MPRFWKIALFLFLLISGAALTFYRYPAALASLLAGGHADVSRDLAYGSLDRQRFDLYVPPDLTPEAPLLIFFYGGAWTFGDKDLYQALGQTFAKENMVVAIPNYRLYPDVTFPHFVEDGAKSVAAILKEVEAKFGKTHPLFLMGHSAGAHIATLLALDAHYLKNEGIDTAQIKGAIGLSGPYDFLPLHEKVYKLIFPENVREAGQPIRFARADAPPLLLLTGLDDNVVKPRNTTSLADAVKAKGGTAEVKTYEGHAHTATLFGLAEKWPMKMPPTRQAVLDFISAYKGEAK